MISDHGPDCCPGRSPSVPHGPCAGACSCRALRHQLALSGSDFGSLAVVLSARQQAMCAAVTWPRGDLNSGAPAVRPVQSIPVQWPVSPLTCTFAAPGLLPPVDNSSRSSLLVVTGVVTGSRSSSAASLNPLLATPTPKAPCVTLRYGRRALLRERGRPSNRASAAEFGSSAFAAAAEVGSAPPGGMAAPLAGWARRDRHDRGAPTRPGANCRGRRSHGAPCGEGPVCGRIR